MMKINIRFTGQLRILANRRSMVASLPEGASLRTLLEQLCQEMPVEFNEKVCAFMLNQNAPLTLILVNHNPLQNSSDLEKPLAEGDTIAFVPPMEGG